MSENKTPQEPGNAPAPHVAALSAAQSVRAEKAARSQSEKIEPTMRALRRILGDYVLEVFPEGFCEAIDGLFKVHAEDADMWAVAEYGNRQERDDALKLMRAYAECAGDKGYTIRQDKETDAEVLRFRVVVRRGSNSDGAA